MNQNITSLDEFAARLVEEKGLEGLDPEVKEQVTKDLRSRLEDRVNAALLTNLPQDKHSEFDRLLDEGDEAKVQNFISASVPKSSEVVAEALLRFREGYLQG